MRAMPALRAARGAAPARLAPLPLAARGGPSCAILDIFRDRKGRTREEILLVSRNGERHWVETSFSPVRDSDGEVRYTVGILRVVDDRKRAELEIQRKNAELERAMAELRERTQQLIHSEKMASIGQLAAGVAHELNTPLNTILGYSQLLKKQLAPATGGAALPREALAEALAEVRSVEAATRRCRDIVQGLLDFSRKSEGIRAPRRVARAIERVFAFLRHDLERRGIAFALDLGADGSREATVLAHENQIEQVLLNLASNAIDAMPEGGRIDVRMRAEREAGRVTIEFADTGCGIAEQDLPRIFEPFFTTKAPGRGTGLGLSIACRIVEDHGGTISVASAPGRGTTFTIRLPLEGAGP